MSSTERERTRRLARVARVREIEERIARAQWVEANGVAEAAERLASSAREGAVQARLDICHAQDQPKVDVPLLLGLTRTLGGLDRRVRRTRDQLRVAAGRRDQSRALWSRAESPRRALDRWLERQRARLEAEKLRREESNWAVPAPVRSAGLEDPPGSPSSAFLPKQPGVEERRGAPDRHPFQR